MSEPIGDLTARMRDIFRLVVEAYIDRGQPVGSKAIAGAVSLSPASIRGVMQELEELGLLTHPHTSAGRIPTETGLRLFVDGIMHNALPPARERAVIEAQLKDRPIEEALAAATATLSGLSACAGVVLAPKNEMRVRQLSFVPLAPIARWRCWSGWTERLKTGLSSFPREPAPSHSPRSATSSAPGWPG